MRFDQILTRADGHELAVEVAALRTPRRMVAEGVHQRGDGSHWQFRFILDEPGRAWELERSDGAAKHRREHYADGVLHNVDGATELAFERAVREPVWMAMPERMVQWGRGHESFSPMLVQRIGTHSLLVTFEHENDPAFRTTLVVDETDGIARRHLEGTSGTIITSVSHLDDSEVPPPATFAPLSDWIRPEY